MTSATSTLAPRRRRLRRDTLVVLLWASMAVALSCFLADRADYPVRDLRSALTVVGVVAGLLATNLMVAQVLLASRIPFVDRAVGHDTAVVWHRQLSTATFSLLGAHIFALWVSWALEFGGLGASLRELISVGDLLLAIVAVGLFAVVGASSIAAARRRLPHEVWLGIHVLTYAAFALAIPHQFSQGGIFASGPARTWWAAILMLTGGCVLAFRVFTPILNSLDHRLRVEQVALVSRDAVAITLSGRNIAGMGVSPGQFLAWRFWTPGLFLHSHPFSISGLSERHLQITVRGLGRGSSAIGRVRPGTVVSFEGPFGIFTADAAAGQAVILAGAGVGLAPLKALLETIAVTPGRALLIVRASTIDEVPHADELGLIAARRGFQTLWAIGPRAGHGWADRRHQGARIVDVAPWVGTADLYVCGPQAWGASLIDDALKAGIDPAAIHHERFGW